MGARGLRSEKITIISTLDWRSLDLVIEICTLGFLSKFAPMLKPHGRGFLRGDFGAVPSDRPGPGSWFALR